MRLKLTVLALLALSSGTQAQPTEKTPEQMLPADALFYFRYDGYEGHRKAYDQTAVAKAMKEGLSEFFEHVFAQIWTLGQTNPLVDNSKKKSAPALEVNQFLDCLWKHGFALSLEIAPPRPGPTNGPTLFQLTVLFPHGAEKTNRAALDAVFRLAAGGAGTRPWRTPSTKGARWRLSLWASTRPRGGQRASTWCSLLGREPQCTQSASSTAFGPT